MSEPPLHAPPLHRPPHHHHAGEIPASQMHAHATTESVYRSIRSTSYSVVPNCTALCRRPRPHLYITPPDFLSSTTHQHQLAHLVTTEDLPCPNFSQSTHRSTQPPTPPLPPNTPYDPYRTPTPTTLSLAATHTHTTFKRGFLALPWGQVVPLWPGGGVNPTYGYSWRTCWATLKNLP